LTLKKKKLVPLELQKPFQHRKLYKELLTFQVLSIFTQVNIPGPSDESLIGPHKRVRINALTLMSSHSKGLQEKDDYMSEVLYFHHSK
jgi:hypothetical protein